MKSIGAGPEPERLLAYGPLPLFRTRPLPDLELLASEALEDDGLSASELHGAVVGIGVCDVEHFQLQDLVDLLGADALSTGESVGEFVSASLDALYAEDMSFKPLLPDDDMPMDVRLVALGAWSQSFLAGLAAGMARQGVQGLAGLPEEAQEIIRDLAAIAQLDPEQTEGDAEADFMQLEEYVKVGTLLIMSLYNDDDADDDSEE